MAPGCLSKKTRRKFRDSIKLIAGNQAKKGEGSRFRTLINLENDGNINAVDTLGTLNNRKDNRYISVNDKSQDFRNISCIKNQSSTGASAKSLNLMGLKNLVDPGDITELVQNVNAKGESEIGKGNLMGHLPPRPNESNFDLVFLVYSNKMKIKPRTPLHRLNPWRQIRPMEPHQENKVFQTGRWCRFRILTLTALQ